jgi:hypothetical protein
LSSANKDCPEAVIKAEFNDKALALDIFPGLGVPVLVDYMSDAAFVTYQEAFHYNCSAEPKTALRAPAFPDL